MAITITIQAETASELASDVLSLAKILADELTAAIPEAAKASSSAVTKPVTPSAVPPTPTPTPVATPAPTAEPAQAAAPSEPAKPDHGITRETLIPHLSALTQAGKRDQVQAIFAKYGADKLSAVDPQHYPAILSEAQALAGAEGGPPV